MKTRRVTLYIDLPAGWQDKAQDEWYFSARTKPDDYQSINDLRVAIDVDLPQVVATYAADQKVTGSYRPSMPVAKVEE